LQVDPRRVKVITYGDGERIELLARKKSDDGKVHAPYRFDDDLSRFDLCDRDDDLGVDFARYVDGECAALMLEVAILVLGTIARVHAFVFVLVLSAIFVLEVALVVVMVIFVIMVSMVFMMIVMTVTITWPAFTVMFVVSAQRKWESGVGGKYPIVEDERSCVVRSRYTFNLMVSIIELRTAAVTSSQTAMPKKVDARLAVSQHRRNQATKIRTCFGTKSLSVGDQFSSLSKWCRPCLWPCLCP